MLDETERLKTILAERYKKRDEEVSAMRYKAELEQMRDKFILNSRVELVGAIPLSGVPKVNLIKDIIVFSKG